MNTPIIDPSTLTEEQKEAIKKLYITHIDRIKKCFHYLPSDVENYIQAGYRSTLIILFGKEFFKEKGE